MSNASVLTLLNLMNRRGVLIQIYLKTLMMQTLFVNKIVFYPYLMLSEFRNNQSMFNF